MILSRYNKLIFSVFSENNEYLILTLYIDKAGSNYDLFLQVQCSKTDPSGNKLPAFVFNNRLKSVDITSRVISFSRGKIIFMNDGVKIDFAGEMVMLYLNYSWNPDDYNAINVLEKEDRGNPEIVWNSFNFRSTVKGNFVSPNTNAKFKNAVGNIDLLKSEKFPLKVNGVLWSRLHSQDLEMAYSLVFNGSVNLLSKLSIFYYNNLVEFSNVDCRITRDEGNSRSDKKFPYLILVSAKNENFQVSVRLYDHEEIAESEIVSEVNFLGNLANRVSGLITRYPKTMKLRSSADLSIVNNMNHDEFSAISAICEYLGVEK